MHYRYPRKSREREKEGSFFKENFPRLEMTANILIYKAQKCPGLNIKKNEKI
jgi:hypothetical protein